MKLLSRESSIALEMTLLCFVSDLWEPLTLQIRREFSESVGQSLLKLVEDTDEIVPERDSNRSSFNVNGQNMCALARSSEAYSEIVDGCCPLFIAG